LFLFFDLIFSTLTATLNTKIPTSFDVSHLSFTKKPFDLTDNSYFDLITLISAFYFNFNSYSNRTKTSNLLFTDELEMEKIPKNFILFDGEFLLISSQHSSTSI